MFGIELKRNVHDIHKFLRTTYYTIAMVNLCTLFIYELKPIVTNVREMPVIRYYWCDIEMNSCYFVLYVIGLIEFIYIYTINTGFDALFISLMAYSYCELEKIKCGFKNYKNDERNDAKSYAELIEHHNVVLNFIKDISDVVTLVLLVQFCSTVVTLCIEVLVIDLDG